MNTPTLIQGNAAATEIFDEVVAEFGPEADHCAHLIALYATLAVDVRQLQDDLNRGGTTLTRPSGMRTLNPKARLLNACRKQMVSVARTLRLTPGKHAGRRQSRGGSLREMLDAPASRSRSALL